MNEDLDRIVSSAPPVVHLTDPAHEQWALEAAEALAAELATPEDLAAAETRFAQNGLPPAAGLAVKLARSRSLLSAITQPIGLSVVLAVYKENLRILPVAQHPHAEDFLRRKLAQLEWLFAGTPHAWDLVVVDDGCPEGSGEIARRILDETADDGHARVLFLEDAIERRLPPAMGLRSTADSQKGGSIRYGLWDAAQRGGGDRIVLFTDADLSTHLGQCGLLVDPIVNGATAAIGSRREPDSVVVKDGGRELRGKLFIFLWKQLIPQLRGVTDTQCGFKAFRAQALAGWFESALESRFSFDIEMLIQVELAHPETTTKVPIAWIDSHELSTTADVSPYLDMLRMVARFYHAYEEENAVSDSYARLIEALDDDSFDRLLENVPPAIADADPGDLERLSDVSAEDLLNRAGLSAG